MTRKGWFVIIQKFDLHTHHNRCGHADGGIRDYIEAGIEKGLNVIGISDHSPYFYSNQEHLHPKIAMGKSEFKHYVKEVLLLKKEYEGKIDVLLGVESDFFAGKMAVYEKQYALYPFDYIIGSVHSVDQLSIFNRNRFKKLNEAEKIQVKDRYYQLIKQSAQSGLFQILGHIDAMKGFYPEFSDIKSKELESTLKVIAEKRVAIEVNTSGKMKACGGWYPSDEILERALHYGIDITFGSDAHSPNRVGDDFEHVQAKLKTIGFKQWCYFKQKEKVYLAL